MNAPEKSMSFLFATWEGGGSVTPALTVARKLRARGHRVRVMSDRCNRPEAEAAGASFIARCSTPYSPACSWNRPWPGGSGTIPAPEPGRSPLPR